MVKTAADIGHIVSEARLEIRGELSRMGMLDRKIKGRLTRTWMPANADAEYKDLFRKASGPWLEFTRDAIAQGVRVDGCNDEAIWQVWQDNGMDGRQGGLTREAIGLSRSYILVLPTEVITVDEDGVESRSANRESVVMRPLSALTTFAHYDEPWDDYPDWVLIRVGPKRINYWQSKWIFVDKDALYRFEGDAQNPSSVKVFEHDMGYTPVARLANTMPTDGEPESSVERAIPVYERIVDATFTLEMVQRYGAFPQKFASGGKLGLGLNVSADSLIHSDDPETKFGSFATASLTDVVVAVDAHIKHLAALCQVPPHYLLGAVVNMSAEGIAAAESGYFRNIGERQDALSEGYELACKMVGDILNIDTDNIQIHYEDVSSRSLAQIADALLKLSTLMPDNLAKLFAMIPGFTQLDATTAAKQEKARQKKAQKQLEAAPAPLAIDAPVVDPASSS